jgi:hypothetical protein
MGTCMICELGRTVADVRGVAWTSEHGPDGTVRWICPPCTRDQLFQIETGLPLERRPAAADAGAARAA